MDQPGMNAIYLIALCGGEVRRWQYLGQDDRSEPRWRDVETGREFSESSVMYAWEIIGRDDAAPAAARGEPTDAAV